MIFNKIKTIQSFDPVTKFRSINGFFVMIGLHLIIPILSDLKGEFLQTYIISLFMIVSTLAVKLNKYFVENYSISSLYRIGVFIHFFLLINSTLYFYNPLYFVVIDSLISIFEISILSSYSIKLDVYQTKHFPDLVESFKIFRNSSFADATLIGLFIILLSSFFASRDVSVMIFIFYNFFLSAYLFSNWNFYKNLKDFKS